MYLIQVLLPIVDETGEPFPIQHFGALRDELTGRYGGVTIYSSAPAEGIWKADSGKPVRDSILLVEVMTSRLDHSWWQSLKQRLEREFRQQEIVVRAIAYEKL